MLDKPYPTKRPTRRGIKLAPELFIGVGHKGHMKKKRKRLTKTKTRKAGFSYRAIIPILVVFYLSQKRINNWFQ